MRELSLGDDHSLDILTILVKARIRGGALGQQQAQVPANIGLWQFVQKITQYSGHSHHLC